MYSYFAFFGLLLLLYFVSQTLTRTLSSVLYRVSSDQTLSMYILAVIFFPGVVIHEVSHYMSAFLLGVHAENVEFFPKMIEGKLKLGSVQIQKTDPLRKTLIGVAPIGGGILVLLGSIYLYKAVFPDSIWAFIIFGIFYFQVANTMFSSKKDMEGTGIFFLLGVLTLFALWLFNIPILEWVTSSDVGIVTQSLLLRGSTYLLIAVAADIFVLIVLFGLKKIR